MIAVMAIINRCCSALLYQKASPGQRSEGGTRHSPCPSGAQKEGGLPQLPIFSHEWVEWGRDTRRASLAVTELILQDEREVARHRGQGQFRAEGTAYAKPQREDSRGAGAPSWTTLRLEGVVEAGAACQAAGCRWPTRVGRSVALSHSQLWVEPPWEGREESPSPHPCVPGLGTRPAWGYHHFATSVQG